MNINILVLGFGVTGKSCVDFFNNTKLNWRGSLLPEYIDAEKKERKELHLKQQRGDGKPACLLVGR